MLFRDFSLSTRAMFSLIFSSLAFFGTHYLRRVLQGLEKPWAKS